ncbi:hypothetical protein RM543_11340 [Roseicyclus sp. F158]|uniref:Uncharacterized protein n=1 Tax=Tropicimonas omnivorans TaxID=3075590 RepID=A0ABU3DHV4_9RHOB|nr:hypothetical protein [Roseicyclus sp. F158]MDT0683283.1 hypothetical protein [Roseicyclus sp. F158]
MTPDEIQALFTRSDGSYRFARWGRPVAPVVFGTDDATLGVVKGAAEAVARLSGRTLAETDPELGSNLMMFFVSGWDELADVPDLDRLVPDLDSLIPRLVSAEANQYRVFRFDAAGAIRACFAFIRMDAHLAELPAETIALGQVVQSALLWSDTAFAGTSPLARTEDGHTILRPEIADVIRAAYDPVMPDMADDPAHALRLFARLRAAG